MAARRRARLGLEWTIRGQHNSQRGAYVARPGVGTVQETLVAAAASDPVSDFLRFKKQFSPRTCRTGLPRAGTADLEADRPW